MTAKAATPPKRRISGFCNVTLPRTTAYDPHQRCPGCDCRATNCPCNPEDPPAMKPTVEPGSYEIPAPPPEEWVTLLVEIARGLDAALLGYDPKDWRDALRLLYVLRTVTATLGKVDANLARWLYLHGEHGQHQTLDGIPGPFYIGRGRDSERWESAAAVQEYVDRKVEQHQGEFTPESVVEWVLEILPATASTALRKTAIKAAGMDLNLYYTSEPGRIRIDLPRPSD